MKFINMVFNTNTANELQAKVVNLVASKSDAIVFATVGTSTNDDIHEHALMVDIRYTTVDPMDTVTIDFDYNVNDIDFIEKQCSAIEDYYGLSVSYMGVELSDEIIVSRYKDVVVDSGFGDGLDDEFESESVDVFQLKPIDITNDQIVELIDIITQSTK